MNWGTGRHGCPGRHLASHEIKIVIANLLLKYEFKFAEGKSRPDDAPADLVNELLVRNLGAE